MKSLASTDVVKETTDRLLRLRADDRPRWGRMSPLQMAQHLACSCEVALGERTVAPVKGPPPGLMKWVALRSGLRWPKNIKTTPELARLIAEEEEVDAQFANAVRAAVEKTQTVADGSRWAKSHPMFGPMTMEDWRRWGYLHADHHLRQFGR